MMAFTQDKQSYLALNIFIVWPLVGAHSKSWELKKWVFAVWGCAYEQYMLEVER